MDTLIKGYNPLLILRVQRESASVHQRKLSDDTSEPLNEKGADDLEEALFKRPNGFLLFNLLTGGRLAEN